jgi:hypothetical protein
MSFITNVQCKHFASWHKFYPKTSPLGNMTLTIGIPSIIKEQGLVSRFIAHMKSKSGLRKHPTIEQ